MKSIQEAVMTSASIEAKEMPEETPEADNYMSDEFMQEQTDFNVINQHERKANDVNSTEKKPLESLKIGEEVQETDILQEKKEINPVTYRAGNPSDLQVNSRRNYNK